MSAPRAAFLGITLLLTALALVFFFFPKRASAPTAFTSDKVKILSPLPGATVAKDFLVTGEARGTWYFEASFPIQVQDVGNDTVGRGIAQAKSDWMTTSFVPFQADVTVRNFSGPATLVLLKDNPSGLPENDDSVSIPIVVQ